MAGIATNIKRIRTHIPAHVTLVCVSKFQPVEAIREAYDAGERHFGESRVQELKAKMPLLPTDIHWHFIGHLQTNKVHDLLKLFADKNVQHPPLLIHSVDSERLLDTISAEAEKLGIIQDILLEIHTAREQSKQGLEVEQAELILDHCKGQRRGISTRGYMTMATNTDDETEIRRCFQVLSELKKQGAIPGAVLSMGMSEDYRIAIECGSDMVRIGSAIFGERNVPAARRTVKAVFFDQDGVLYNSMPYHAESWAWAMTRHGLPYTALETYRNEGRTSTGVIQELHRRLYGTEATPELIETIYKDKTDHFTELTGGFPGIIPDVDKVLQYLHGSGIQCWVVTGSGQRNLINALNDTFDNVFTGIISSFDVKHGKPDPEPYLKAWEKSGFAKEECMVVENAPLGVRAAKAAGLFTIAVNTGILPDSDLENEHADVIFHNMAELLEWLKKTNN